MESLLDAVKALEAKGLLRKGGREAGEEEQEKVVDIITHVLGRGVHRRQSFKCGRERVKFYLAPAKLFNISVASPPLRFNVGDKLFAKSSMGNEKCVQTVSIPPPIILNSFNGTTYKRILPGLAATGRARDQRRRPASASGQRTFSHLRFGMRCRPPTSPEPSRLSPSSPCSPL